MRRIRYCVAMSLDGYVAGPNGEFDWIAHDPDIDFGKLIGSFDTLLMGRKTYEFAKSHGPGASIPGMNTIVVSRTLRADDHPNVTVISCHVEETVARLRAQPGKDVWLFGGGELFASLLNAGLVDTVEVGVTPVLLGGGVPLLPPPAKHTKLKLAKSQVYEKTGILRLEYEVKR